HGKSAWRSPPVLARSRARPRRTDQAPRERARVHRVLDGHPELRRAASPLMPVRDIDLVVVIAGLLPVCFFRTCIGVLVWVWLAFMNPHRLTWGFANTLPFSEWVAMATLAGLVFSGDRKRFVWTRETILLLALWAWFCVTTLTALYPEAARGQLERVSKILL